MIRGSGSVLAGWTDRYAIRSKKGRTGVTVTVTVLIALDRGMLLELLGACVVIVMVIIPDNSNIK